MNNLMNSDQSYTGLVQKYIGSAYDNVYSVSQHLEMLKIIAESLDNGDLQDLALFIETFNAVMAAIADFNNTYYGTYATHPTERPDGSEMMGGDLYYNSTLGGLYVYELHSSGSLIWSAMGASHIFVEHQVALEHNQELFTLTTFTYPPNTGNLSVYVNGLRQIRSAVVEVSPTQVQLNQGVAIGSNVEFIYNERLGGTGANMLDAINITYDPAGTSLAATNVQEAIDEILDAAGGLDVIDSGTY